MMVGDGRAAGGWDDPVSFAGVVLSLRLAPICGDVISCRTMSEAIRAKLVLRKRGPDLPPRRIPFAGLCLSLIHI